jgi:hypothetical protein
VIDEGDAVESAVLGGPRPHDDVVDAHPHLGQEQEPLGHGSKTVTFAWRPAPDARTARTRAGTLVPQRAGVALRSPRTRQVRGTMAKPNGAGPRQPVAESRAESFMRSALAILGETGRTDFTVLEVVERSKTSLRAFYQHFATKDELLLALVEKIMTDATAHWRAETAALPSEAGCADWSSGSAHRRSPVPRTASTVD